MAKIGKTVSVIELDYGDLEDLVNKVYGGKDKEEYSFVATEECGNDSDHKFPNISAAPFKNEWDQKDADELRSGKFPCYRNYTLLKALCQDGHLEPGDYLVRVCW